MAYKTLMCASGEEFRKHIKDFQAFSEGFIATLRGLKTLTGFQRTFRIISDGF